MIKNRVGFAGVLGAYAEEAIYKLYKRDEVEVIALESFDEVCIALEKELIDFGVLPLENSTTGAIHEVYDLLRERSIYLVSEVCLPIEHCLVGLRGAKLEWIERVYSHEQGLSQCANWIKRAGVEKVAMSNTALSARHVSEGSQLSWAAIASEVAAKAYGLEILERNIGNSQLNTTRFGLLSKGLVVSKEADSTSIVLTTAHKAGALYEILRVFAQAGVNLFRIESRPILDKPWEYYIYLDAEGAITDSSIAKVIEKVKSCCSFYKFLGSYRRHQSSQ